MFLRNDTLRYVVNALKIWHTICDRQAPASKVVFERPTWNRSVPITRLAFWSRHRRQVVGRNRTVAPHLLKYFVKVGFSISHLRNRAVLPRFETLSPISQQRPCGDRDDRSLMRPLLGAVAIRVGELIESRPVIRTETRPEHQVLRRQQHIHEVELKQAHVFEHAAKMSAVGTRGRAFTIKALCRERNPTCLIGRHPHSPYHNVVLPE